MTFQQAIEFYIITMRPLTARQHAVAIIESLNEAGYYIAPLEQRPVPRSYPFYVSPDFIVFTDGVAVVLL